MEISVLELLQQDVKEQEISQIKKRWKQRFFYFYNFLLHKTDETEAPPLGMTINYSLFFNSSLILEREFVRSRILS